MDIFYFMEVSPSNFYTHLFFHIPYIIILFVHIPYIIILLLLL